MIITKVKTQGNDLSLCTGEPLFGKGKKVDWGWDNTYPMFSKYIKLGFIRFSTKADLVLNFGLCGPSWATEMEVEATMHDDNKSMHFIIKEDTLLAGLQTADSLTFGLMFDVSIRVPIINDIEKKFDLSASSSLITLIAYLYKALTGTEIGFDKDKNSFHNINGWPANLTGIGVDQFMSKGFMNAEPSYKLKWSIVELIAKFVPAFMPVFEALEWLEKKSNLVVEFGPFVGIGIPVKLDIEEITMGENAIYKPILKDGKIDFHNSTYAKAEMKNFTNQEIKPDEFAIKFKETTSVGVVFGFFVEVGLNRLFYYESEVKIDLVKMLGIDSTLQENYVTLEGEEVRTVAQNDSKIMEVVFV